MNKKKPKRIKSGEERTLLFNLYHNGLFKQKIIPNKKKKTKKFDIKKEVSYYLSCFLKRLFKQ